MWVTIKYVVEVLKPALTSLFLNGFTHNLSHRLNGFYSPLTWGYEGFPQKYALVTTTTYNYIKTPVRFPLVNFFYQLFKTKNLQSFTTAGRLTK